MISTRHTLRALSGAGMGEPPWQPVQPPADAPLSCYSDIVIAGGGLTGLFAASMLAALGREVVVVDGRFGGGATARSGGVVLGGTAAGPCGAFEGCEESLRNWIVSRRVDCGLAWEGCLELVRDEALPSSPIDWNDNGRVRLSGAVNGGVLDPARLLSALIQHAIGAGACLVNGAGVESIEGSARIVTVETPRGVVTARHVVMATDAMLAPDASAGDPWDKRAITVAMQTEPLGGGAIAALGLRPHIAFYTDDDPLLWGRVMPDSSLVIGRELLPPAFDLPSQWQAASIALAGERLLARTRALHPAAADARLARAWGGPIARTSAGVPAVIVDPAMPPAIWAGGYGGHGIAQAFRVAELVVARLTAAS